MNDPGRADRSPEVHDQPIVPPNRCWSSKYRLPPP